MTRPTTLADGFKGLHTKLDESEYGKDDNGLAWLLSSQNVDISDKYKLSVRPGQERILTPTDPTKRMVGGYSHPMLGGLILLVEDDALTLFNPSTESVVSRLADMTPGRPLSCAYNGGRVYYTNGAEQGYIDCSNLLANSWVAEGTLYAPDTTEEISTGPPLFSMIHFYAGRMFGGVGREAVVRSNPFDKSRFVLDGNSDIVDGLTMITSTESNLIISDMTGVYCYHGTDPAEFQPELIHKAPAVQGTAQQIPPTDIGLDGVKMGVICTTADGVVFIGDDSSVIQITKDKIDIPPLADFWGTSAICNGKYYCNLNVQV